jgi:hypothetical protein
MPPLLAVSCGGIVTFEYRSDPILAGALAYWQAKRGNRSMPSRRDIDPVEVPKLLPNLQLIEMVAGGRWRYRLIGTALVEAFGRDYTGQFPDELFDAPRARSIIETHNAVREARQPMFLRSRYITTKDVDIVANRLYLPLSDDDREVNMILGALTFAYGAVVSIAGAWGGSARLASAISEMEMVDAASA